MIENIKKIEKSGIRAFIKSEKQKWACKKCGGVVCIHTAACVVCKKPFQKNRTK